MQAADAFAESERDSLRATSCGMRHIFLRLSVTLTLRHERCTSRTMNRLAVPQALVFAMGAADFEGGPLLKAIAGAASAVGQSQRSTKIDRNPLAREAGVTLDGMISDFCLHTLRPYARQRLPLRASRPWRCLRALACHRRPLDRSGHDRWRDRQDAWQRARQRLHPRLCHAIVVAADRRKNG